MARTEWGNTVCLRVKTHDKYRQCQHRCSTKEKLLCGCYRFCVLSGAIPKSSNQLFTSPSKAYDKQRTVSDLRTIGCALVICCRLSPKDNYSVRKYSTTLFGTIRGFGTIIAKCPNGPDVISEGVVSHIFTCIAQHAARTSLKTRRSRSRPFCSDTRPPFSSDSRCL